MSKLTHPWRAGLLALAAVTALACGNVPDPDAKPMAGPSGATAVTVVSQAPAVTYAVPVAADFRLTVKILEKKCFGSAGCNVTYRIELAQVNDKKFDPSKEYEVTYEVKGTDDPQINTLTVTGAQYSTDQEEFTSTPSSKSKLTATITDISEG